MTHLYVITQRLGVEKRTHVDIKGGQHPEWDGEVRFTITKNAAAKYRKLEVSCYAQEPRSEDLLGKGVVDISETLRTGEFDGIFAHLSTTKNRLKQALLS